MAWRGARGVDDLREAHARDPGMLINTDTSKIQGFSNNTDNTFILGYNTRIIGIPEH